MRYEIQPEKVDSLRELYNGIKERPVGISSPALELILSDAKVAELGKMEASYKNRYPDYHNCCTYWGS